LIVTCPHCGFRQRDTETVCLYGQQWGSPIKHCPHCNREFYEKGILEAAVAPAPKFPGFPIKLFSFETVGLIFGPICLLSQLLSYDLKLFIVGIVWSVFCIIGVISLIIPLKKMKKEYWLLLGESKKRISDPEYISKLSGYWRG